MKQRSGCEVVSKRPITRTKDGLTDHDFPSDYIGNLPPNSREIWSADEILVSGRTFIKLREVKGYE
jgi:hypothetical protein